MTADQLIEEIIALIWKEVLSWRKTGDAAIASRLEEVIREYVANLKKR